MYQGTNVRGHLQCAVQLFLSFYNQVMSSNSLQFSIQKTLLLLQIFNSVERTSITFNQHNVLFVLIKKSSSKLLQPHDGRCGQLYFDQSVVSQQELITQVVCSLVLLSSPGFILILDSLHSPPSAGQYSNRNSISNSFDLMRSDWELIKDP